jgi:hypothetical protein
MVDNHIPYILPSGKLKYPWKNTILKRSINYKWGMFNSYVTNYQRVNPIVIPLFTIVNHRKSQFIVVKSPCSYGFPMVSW